jgi:hypothetical protein
MAAGRETTSPFSSSSVCTSKTQLVWRRQGRVGRLMCLTHKSLEGGLAGDLEGRQNRELDGRLDKVVFSRAAVHDLAVHDLGVHNLPVEFFGFGCLKP